MVAICNRGVCVTDRDGCEQVLAFELGFRATSRFGIESIEVLVAERRELIAVAIPVLCQGRRPFNNKARVEC